LLSGFLFENVLYIHPKFLKSKLFPKNPTQLLTFIGLLILVVVVVDVVVVVVVVVFIFFLKPPHPIVNLFKMLQIIVMFDCY